MNSSVNRLLLGMAILCIAITGPTARSSITAPRPDSNNGKYILNTWISDPSLPGFFDGLPRVIDHFFKSKWDGSYSKPEGVDLNGTFNLTRLAASLDQLNRLAGEFKQHHPGEPAMLVLSISTYGNNYGGEHFSWMQEALSMTQEQMLECVKGVPVPEWEEKCHALSSDTLMRLLAHTGFDEILVFLNTCYAGQAVENFNDRFWSMVPSDAKNRNFRLALFSPVSGHERALIGAFERNVEYALRDKTISSNGYFTSFTDLSKAIRYYNNRYQDDGLLRLTTVYQTPGFPDSLPMLLTTETGGTVHSKIRHWKDVTLDARGQRSSCGFSDTPCVLEDSRSHGLLWAALSTTAGTLAEASRSCADLDANGLSGWRLPTGNELSAVDNFNIRPDGKLDAHTLAHLDRYKERFDVMNMRTLDRYFPGFGTSDATVWSSSSGKDGTPFYMNLVDGSDPARLSAAGMPGISSAFWHCVRAR